MFRADSDTADNLDRYRRRVREGVSKLRGLEIGDELAVEILAQLVDGRKSTAEIVELIYGLRKGDEGYTSCYSRVDREIRKLESKGLLSRKLFGRDKPYRLTELAMINLSRIGGGETQLSVIPWFDRVAYAATASLSVPVALLTLGWLTLADLGVVGVFGCFCFFLGISFYGAVRTVRRVF